MTGSIIEILLVEDNSADIKLIQKAFQRAKIKNRLNIARHGEDALALLRGKTNPQEISKPDIILLDLNMPGMSGLNGLLDLRNECPTTPVVVVSAEEEKQTILQTLAYGAVGFIAKSSSKDTIGDALESVLNGNVYLPSDIIRNTDNQRSSGGRQHDLRVGVETLSSLTRRQLMVLKCMTKGEANKQIAYNLNISETTVKSHVSSILKKLGVYNRVQAVVGCSDIDFNQYLKR